MRWTRAHFRELFRFLWAWGGIAPVGCSVQVYHPLYVMAYVKIGDDFANDLGAIQLTSWGAFLAAGPTDPPTHSGYPWPAMEIQQHLFQIHYYYVLEHPERSRHRLARYVPALETIFEHAISLLSTSWHDDSSWNQSVRKHLRQIEELVGWERPAEEVELAEAAAAGDVARVQGLLAAGTNPDAWGADGAAPIHRAAHDGRSEVVSALLEAGVPPDATFGPPGYTALMGACKTGKPRAARLLLQAGANPNARTDDGQTPLSLALENDHAEVVEALREAGAGARLGRQSAP